MACHIKESDAYPNTFSFIINNVLFPFKMIIPQYLIKRIPVVVTNETIRFRLVSRVMCGKVLDIGCGNNKLIKSYRERGSYGIGVDIYPWEGVDLCVEDSSNLIFPDNSFDTVCIVACLNHIPYREAVLGEVRRILMDNGRVVITNLRPFYSRFWHAWNYYRSRDLQERGMKKGEVYGFTKKEVLQLFHKMGFELEFFLPFSWAINQLYVFTPIS